VRYQLLCLPTAQLVHVEAPTTSENVPTPQLVQTEAPASEYVPAAQMVQIEAPAAEYVPAAQLVLSPSEMQKSSVARTSEARPSRKAMSQAFEHVGRQAWRR
jgi:hypothetical protein